MPKYAIEQAFNGSISTATSSYDSTKINLLGNHLRIYNQGSNPSDKFLSPILTKVIRYSEISGITMSCIHVIAYGNYHYLFIGLQGTAAATRTFAVYSYNKVTEAVGGGGTNTITFPTATAHTLRGIRPTLRSYTTGTVSVSGTTVTGSGTTWTTDGMCVGSRIGFGNTSGPSITTWYEISAVNSDTQITLTGSAGTIAAGSSYVIEDLRMGVATTNATVANGGMFVIKGLRLDSLSGGLNIAAATTVDNIRAVYKLNDAATATNTIASGITAGEYVSWQEEYMYVLNNNTTTTLSFFKYNIRAALTPTAGVATLSAPNVVITGAQAVTGGTLLATNNGRYCTPSHGPGSGSAGIYVTCTTRMMRASVADITAGSTSFFKDQMIESVVGGANNTTTVGFTQCDYSSSLDKFIISGYTAPTGRIYVSSYKTDGSALDLYMSMSQAVYDAGASTNPAFPKLQAQAALIWAEEGILYIVNAGTSPIGQAYIYPAFGAHWDYYTTTNNLAILPEMSLVGSPSVLNKVYVSSTQYVAGTNNLDKATEPYRVLYRTTGISDNSGAWTAADVTGDLSAIEPVSNIQFAIAFRTMGDICIPARVTSLTLVYESPDALPDEYQWNLGDSNTVDGTFGFTQFSLFTSWPAVHTIKIYRSDNNTLALEQSSSSTTLGVFEYWTGSAWTAGLDSNAVGTRRRFRPTSSLPGGVNLYAVLSVS